MDKATIAALERTPLFQGLSRRELKSLAQAGKTVAVPAGRKIVEEGDPGIAFHLILSGNAKVTVNERSRAKLGPGDHFGEMSLIDKEPRIATVTAETDVENFVLSTWNFQRLIKDSPSIAHKLLIEMTSRLRRLEKSLQH